MSANNSDRENLRIDIIPGTEVMVDQGIKGEAAESQGGDRTVLVPPPSDNPNDPLNWRFLWKTSAIVAASSVSFTQGFSPLALAPMIPYLMKEYDRSLEDVIRFTGVTILVLGFSNFIWVPIASSFGRRPVLIASQMVCLASHLWRAKATSYNSFLGAAILSGIGSGPGETIQPAIIADLFFLQDSGKWNTLYWVTYMGALMVAPIVAGAMAEHGGWPTFWWLSAGLTSLSLLLIIFGFPETMWHREPSGQLLLSADTLTASKAVAEHHETQSPEKPYEKTDDATTIAIDDRHAYYPLLSTGSPSRQQWRPYQLNANPTRRILRDLWTPWRLFTYPIVLFTSFVVSWSCSNLLILNLTQSQVFAAAPYGWSAQSVGFTNFALFGGIIIGLFTAGPFSDWVSARATARNGGIREPEMRLPALIPYVAVMVLGNCITAVGYQRGWPWQPIVVVGYGCAGIQVAALPGIASSYAIDSYKPVTGALFVAITVNKNLWGYGLAEFVTRWSVEAG
ncbi:MFS transporter, putative [Cordyceps militaris]|uniref:MFS transporter, putative n=1 Tax=Cordyceps militaris TaxID=73501 RepID=A0A2H4SV10_CORMI|nr:MFS transporter, putative [Cordyceps militaris]